MAGRWHTLLYTAATATMLGVSFPACAESLKPLLNTLLLQHPRIKAEAEKVQAAEASREQAFSGYLPRMDASASTGYENTDRTALYPPAGEYDLHPDNASLILTQNLFEGFRTKGSLKAADAGIEQAKASLEAAKQQLTLEAITAYLNVMKQQKLSGLADGNMQNLQQQLHLEDEKVDRGSGIAVDVLQAKSRLQISKERHTAFMGSLQDAISNYVQLFGSPPPATLELPGVPLKEIPDTLEQAIEKAIANNPSLHIASNSAEIAEHQQEIAKSSYYPSVDVVAATSYKDDVSGIRGEEKSNSVIIRGTWQLFSGFADQARVKQAAHQHQSAISSVEDAKRRLTEQVKTAWTNLQISTERAELLDNAVNIAGEVYDARKRLRDAGSDTALNVLDAENELFRAQIDAASARFDCYAAVYRLMLAMGTLKADSL